MSAPQARPRGNRRALAGAAVAALGAAVAVACGGGTFELAIDASALSTPQPVGSFQVQFARPSQPTCEVFYNQATCARNVYQRSDLVPIRVGKDGKEVPAVVIDAAIQLDGDGGTQTTQVEVPLGVGYTLIIEALGTEATPRLVASSCTPAGQVNAGRNAVLANPFKVYGTEDAGSIDCGLDPRWDR